MKAISGAKQHKQRESMTTGEHAIRRLEDLYELSKLFATFETIEQTFAPALDIVARTLPLCSAILIDNEEGTSRMISWPSDGGDTDAMRVVKARVEAAYAYLVGGVKALARHAHVEGDAASRFIVIPLVVTHRRPFGVFQLEAAQPLDKTDLFFVNAIANQLAIALDRDRARRQDITRLRKAEAGRTHAEAEGLVAEKGRVNAESDSQRFATLAAENDRLYQQAQHEVRLREQVLAIVSHDLRNPLGTILMTADALVKKGDIPLPSGRIKRAAERMLRLIEDLLDFASIEAGQLSIRRTPQDPGWLVQETVTSFEGAAHEKGLRLAMEIEPDLPNVFCDRDRVLQALSNLVGNATKATPSGGHIVVTVRAKEHGLLFAVADDGPGISEEDVTHVFERYWRSRQAVYDGAGLGLAITRGIIDAHRGRVWAESTLGHGATFFFTIPAPEAASV